MKYNIFYTVAEFTATNYIKVFAHLLGDQSTAAIGLAMGLGLLSSSPITVPLFLAGSTYDKYKKQCKIKFI